MTMLPRVRRWLAVVAHREAHEREMHVEFESHVAHRADELERQGLPRDAAERAARIEFGGMENFKEAGREARGLRLWDETRANVAFAARGIRHRPLIAVIVIVTLSLGIGISAGVFATINAVALRPRAGGNPRTFVSIFSAYGTDSTPPGFPGLTALSDYLVFRERTRSLSALAGSSSVSAPINDQPQPARGMLVTCEFFDVDAADRPVVGRTFRADDCASRTQVVVVSEAFWRDALSAAPDVVDRVIRINGRPVRVIGVAPASFGGVTNDAKFWIPYTLRGYLNFGPDDPAAPNALRLSLEGRLRSGFARSDVASELRLLATRQDRLHTGRRTSVFITNGSLLDKPGNGFVVVAIVSLILVGLSCLALVACGNVVSLLLSVAYGRQTEMALRMALGSGSGRLGAMLLTETLSLSAIAGVISIVIAIEIPGYLMSWILQRPVSFPAGTDWRVFAFLSAITIVAGAVVGMAPVRAALRLDLVAALRGLSKHSRVGRAGATRALVALEIAGAVALLVAATALMRMPARIANAPPHFASRQVMELNVVAADRDSGTWRAYDETLRLAVARVPGVESIAFGSATPVSDERIASVSVVAAGEARRALPAIEVSPNYLGVLGIPLLRGRSFTAQDEDCSSSRCPVIVSREVVRELWPSVEPLGQRLVVDATLSLEVVGVAADASSDVAGRTDALMLYFPWAPTSHRYRAFARFSGNADNLSHELAAAIASDVPGSSASPATIQSMLDRLTGAFERIGLVVGLVAIVAAVLALVGVYGVVSLSAKRRMKEMGIRIALGASDADVYRAMLSTSAPPVAIGLVAGMAVVIAVIVIADRLTGAALPVRMADPLAFWGPPLLLAVVTLAAILAPARRAAGANPVSSLRED